MSVCPSVCPSGFGGNAFLGPKLSYSFATYWCFHPCCFNKSFFYFRAQNCASKREARKKHPDVVQSDLILNILYFIPMPILILWRIIFYVFKPPCNKFWFYHYFLVLYCLKICFCLVIKSVSICHVWSYFNLKVGNILSYLVLL